REKVSGLECKHRLVSRAPRGSEGGDDSPQSKAAPRTPVMIFFGCYGIITVKSSGRILRGQRIMADKRFVTV
ncbi:MAG: hypothetical protein AB1742_01795, partial [bacterium]